MSNKKSGEMKVNISPINSTKQNPCFSAYNATAAGKAALKKLSTVEEKSLYLDFCEHFKDTKYVDVLLDAYCGGIVIGFRVSPQQEEYMWSIYAKHENINKNGFDVKYNAASSYADSLNTNSVTKYFDFHVNSLPKIEQLYRDLTKSRLDETIDRLDVFKQFGDMLEAGYENGQKAEALNAHIDNFFGNL